MEGIYKQELYALYCSPNIIQEIKLRMRWVRHVARMGDRRSEHSVLVGRSEGKTSLGKPRLRWEDNIKINLQEVGWRVMEGIPTSTGTGSRHL